MHVSAGRRKPLSADVSRSRRRGASSPWRSCVLPWRLGSPTWQRPMSRTLPPTSAAPCLPPRLRRLFCRSMGTTPRIEPRSQIPRDSYPHRESRATRPHALRPRPVEILLRKSSRCSRAWCFSRSRWSPRRECSDRSSGGALRRCVRVQRNSFLQGSDAADTHHEGRLRKPLGRSKCPTENESLIEPVARRLGQQRWEVRPSLS